MIILYLTIFFFFCYSILIIYYWVAWQSIPEYVPNTKQPDAKISVVIPARNEEDNIISCLKSVCNQDYPRELYQIVAVDDCSTDRTWELIQGFHSAGPQIFPVHLEEIDESGFSAHKKRAIQSGIEVSDNNVIVTTDSDCKHYPEWIKTVASFYEEKKSVFITAPVVFESDGSFLQNFQTLDFLVLQGITGASVYKNVHSMCNGANLAYERKVFDEVNGFDGIDKIASGDDMLLMYKIWRKYPAKVHYLKSKRTIVSTQPMKTWKEFFNQRVRWASKARFYKDWRVFLVLLLVYIFNLSFLALFIAGFWSPVLWIYLLVLWFAKTIIEYPFVYSVAKFFDRQSLLKYFFFFQPPHIAYTIIAGWLGQFGKYEWKGRKVK